MQALSTGNCSLSDAEADRSFIKNHAARVKIIRKGTQIHAAFSRYSIEPSGCSLPLPPKTAKIEIETTSGDQLHHADAHIAKSAVNAERPPCFAFGKKKLMLAILRQVGSGEAAQQR